MGLYFGAGGAGGFCAEAIAQKHRSMSAVENFDEIIAVIAVLFALKQIPFAGILGDVQLFNPLLWRSRKTPARCWRYVLPALCLEWIGWRLLRWRCPECLRE